MSLSLLQLALNQHCLDVPLVPEDDGLGDQDARGHVEDNVPGSKSALPNKNYHWKIATQLFKNLALLFAS